MSRYIDADHAEFRLQCCGTYHGVIAFDTVKAVLNDAPGVDIVRCAECKHSPQNTKEIPLHDSCYTFNLDDFCSYGERRVDEHP